jgi:hypothetical protein
LRAISFQLLNPTLAQGFLSILSIKRGNWFYWGRQGGNSGKGGNQRIRRIHAYLRLLFLENQGFAEMKLDRIPLSASTPAKIQTIAHSYKISKVPFAPLLGFLVTAWATEKS